VKSVPDSYAASTRATRIATSGPGPNETGTVKQGMSSGKWPGTRQAGQQGPGTRCDNAATVFAGKLGSKVGG
jgi:hypothetical protein